MKGDQISSCSKRVPKACAVGYSVIDLGLSHALQTEVEQHSTDLLWMTNGKISYLSFQYWSDLCAKVSSGFF